MFKQALQKIIRQCGYDLFKHDARYHEVICRCGLLKQEELVVLDVGANTGQFAKELRDQGFGGKIVSFEPQSSAHTDLTEASSGDENWVIAERGAIGSERGEAEINISANSVSSSLLPMEQCHAEIAPSSAYVGTETVEVRRLDDVVTIEDGVSFYLKVDTQGFEKHVLDGAPEVLSKSRVVELELSLVPTYGGCLLFPEGLRFMEGLGFRLFSTYQVLKNRETGELLQVNAFFVRI